MKPIITLVWLLSALPLAAQQAVPVRSGEHDGFTRLVLHISPDVAWELEQSRGRAAMVFPEQSLSFAIEQVFDRIGKTRIADVSATQAASGSALELVLPCSCEVKSFAFNDRYIVVDVYDGPPLPAETPSETAETSPQWRPDSLPFIQPSNAPIRFTAYVMQQAPAQPALQPDPSAPEDQTPTPQMASPAAPDMVAVVADAPAAENVVEAVQALAGAAVSSMNTEVVVEDDPEMRARIQEAQTQLLAQLTRAADQGLVEFVPAPVAAVAPKPTPAPVPEPEEEAEPLDPALLQQLSARTAYAQGNEDALSEIVNQFAMPQCLDDSAFSMEGWGGDGHFSDQLASLRSQLLGEFDAPDADIAEQIIQLYLRYGLGAEARLMIRETDVELENAALYKDMAALLEGEPERVSGPVLQGAGCGGTHEMWYLATGAGRYHVLEPLSITDAFSAYPIELRSLLGPPLAQAFINRDQIEAGHVVLEIVRRAESGVTSAQRMAEAQVMEAQGDIQGAGEVYRKLALANGEVAPQALIAYARTVLAADTPPPETLLVDLESAAFFHRETEAANPLRLAEIRVRSAVAGPEAGLAQIAENLTERPAMTEALQEITAEIFQTASAEAMGDYAYAQMVLRYADLLAQGPKGDAARLRIAQEMAAIGLPEAALDVLAPNLSRPHAAPARHIEAAAYVQLFEPEQALAVLGEDSSLGAYKIRLNAHLQMGDYAAVAALLNDPHAKDISLTDVALRAGDWEKIQDAGAVGALASYVQGAAQSEALPPMVADESPTLRAARSLLADNARSVRVLEDVLAEGQ